MAKRRTGNELLGEPRGEQRREEGVHVGLQDQVVRVEQLAVLFLAEEDDAVHEAVVVPLLRRRVTRKTTQMSPARKGDA